MRGHLQSLWVYRHNFRNSTVVLILPIHSHSYFWLNRGGNLAIPLVWCDQIKNHLHRHRGINDYNLLFQVPVTIRPSSTLCYFQLLCTMEYLSIHSIVLGKPIWSKEKLSSLPLYLRHIQKGRFAFFLYFLIIETTTGATKEIVRPAIW